MEEKKMKEFEEIKNKRIHAVYERVEKECEKILEIDSSKQRRRSGRITSRSVRNLKDGEGLYNVLRGTNDPESLMVSNSVLCYLWLRLINFCHDMYVFLLLLIIIC